MRIKILILTCFAFVIGLQSQAQTMEYDIIWLGKIGKLYINQTSANDSLLISTNSEVKIPFYTLNWKTDTKSYNGKLLNAEYQQLLNKKKREGAKINLKTNNKWNYTDTEGADSEIDIQHNFFVSRLYFQEPLEQKFIFSERFGKPLELINHGNGHYKLLLPDDNYCEYFYEDGICKIVKAKNGSRTIKMVLSEGS